MRHLVVADLHYSLRQWDWVVRNAGQFDGVIIAGDLLDIASSVDREAQIVVILKYLQRLSQITPKLLVTSGNHDLDDADSDGQRNAAWLEKAKAFGVTVDGDSCVVGEWLISLCPWCETEKARLEVAAKLAADARLPKRRWMWIHHEPPQGTKTSWTGHRDGGTPVLVDWIQQYRPDLVLCGHIHQAPFRPEGGWVDRMDKTWVFNAGSYRASEPPFIILDLGRDQAHWVSAAGRETAELALL